ncbi:ABC transporter permease [Acidothermaceae bacterium B102]|nr:ABC transporter permease [Acidothermaceae bacterium B102]
MTQGINDAIGAGDSGQILEVLDPGMPNTKVIEGRSPFALAFDRLRRDRGAMISLYVIIAIIVVAIAAPIFAAVTGHGVDTQYRGLDALSPAGAPHAPSSTFWFGTDDQGRDLLVRTAYGARASLEVGISATALTMIIGVTIGLFAGYYGGWIDILLARLIDVILSVPYLLLAIALVEVLGHISLWIVIAIIAAFGWAGVARIIRGQVISIREREFVEAARSLGSSDMRIIFVDILPNVIAPAIVFSTLLLPASVLTEAALSFLGVGIPPPTPDWGQMISDAQQYYQQAWWYLAAPGVALLLTTLAFNIFGDGVRDAFDPRTDRLFAK